MQNLESLYQQSLELIDSIPDLMTNKIPDHLLRVWLYNGPIVPNPTQEQLVSIAIYKYANEKYGDKLLSPQEDCHRYESFQYQLATEYVCRKVGAKLRPRQIFNFSNYSAPLNIDIKSKQIAKFKRLAATLAPLQDKREVYSDGSYKQFS